MAGKKNGKSISGGARGSGLITYFVVAGVAALGVVHNTAVPHRNFHQDTAQGKAGCTQNMNQLTTCVDMGADLSATVKSWRAAMTEKYGAPPAYIDEMLATGLAGIEQRLGAMRDRHKSNFRGIGQFNIHNKLTAYFDNIQARIALLTAIVRKNPDSIRVLTGKKINVALLTDNAVSSDPVIQAITFLENAYYNDKYLSKNFKDYNGYSDDDKRALLYLMHNDRKVALAIAGHLSSCDTLRTIMPTEAENMAQNPKIYKGGTITPRQALDGVKKEMAPFQYFADEPANGKPATDATARLTNAWGAKAVPKLACTPT